MATTKPSILRRFPMCSLAHGVAPPSGFGPRCVFASVEQLDHPEWRGKPVIVGGSPEKRGVVSTCSYEARTYGVHSAMSSAQATRLCPDAIWTPGHFARYREMSTQVMAILADETPYVEQVSIDEAFFDISPGRFTRESPIAIARRISDRVAELGITCSIGLGRNKTVAKSPASAKSHAVSPWCFPAPRKASWHHCPSEP